MNDLLSQFAAAQSESKTVGDEAMQLMEKAVELHKEISELKEALDEKEKDLSALKQDILSDFKKKNITKLEAFNFEFKNTPKLSVKVPKTPEEKKAFFGWLEEKGLFYSKVSIHSAALNSTYNEAFAEFMTAQGEDNKDAVFSIPGIEKPSPYNILEIKPVKEKKVKLSRAKV